MTYREEINGTPKIRMGRLLKPSYETWEEALQVQERLEKIHKDYTYEITGIQGNYCIVERSLNSTETKYH